MKLDDFVERELERLQGRIESGSGGVAGRLRQSRLALIALALTTAFLQLRGLPAEFSSTTLDAAAILQDRRVEPKHVILVAIDNADYEKFFGGVSPLNPSMLGELLKAIASGQPALIVVDLETSHRMFQSLAAPQDTRIIWAVPNEDDSNKTFVPAKALGGSEMPATWSTALALTPNDDRGIVRSYWRRFPVKSGTPVPSLEFASSQVYQKRPLPAGPVRSSENVRLLDFRYQIVPVPARSVLEFAQLPEWAHGILRDKVVVLGGTYSAARNRYATPVRAMDGAEIATQGIEAEIENTSISPVNPWLAGLLQLLAGLGIVFVYNRFQLRTAVLSSLLLIPLLSVVASLLLFHRLAMWAALMPILLAVLIAEIYTKASLYFALCTKLKSLRHEEPKTSPASTDLPKTI